MSLEWLRTKAQPYKLPRIQAGSCEQGQLRKDLALRQYPYGLLHNFFFAAKDYGLPELFATVLKDTFFVVSLGTIYCSMWTNMLRKNARRDCFWGFSLKSQQITNNSKSMRNVV